MPRGMTRRNFVRTTTLAAAAAAGSVPMSCAVQQELKSAKEKLNVAFIGTGRMGRHNISVQQGTGLVNVVAVCDVYEPNLNEALKMTNGKAKAYKDFRYILDDKTIDAVVISTPDHWHALMTTMACDAGKDVFVEKPASVTIEEGRRMVEAARYHKAIVQLGTMQRSAEVFHKAVKLVQSGALGKITNVRTWLVGNQFPNGIGNPADSEPPVNLDWDLWLGPAQMRPFNANRFGVGDRWSTFRYFWDYAGGMMTDWGTHLLDIVLWAMEEKAPSSIMATGGKFGLTDNRETPDTLHVSYQFNDFVAEFTNQACNSRGVDGQGYGIEFYGSRASLFVDRGGYKLMPQEGGKFDRSLVPEDCPYKWNSNDSGNDAHAKNWIASIYSGELPICDIETGHRSTSIALLGNIAYRTQERLEWDADKEIFTNSSRANELLKNNYRNPWSHPKI